MKHLSTHKKNLHKTTLHISCFCSLHSGVHQTFASTHCVEEELCRCEARVETIPNKAFCCWDFGCVFSSVYVNMVSVAVLIFDMPMYSSDRNICRK